MIALALAACGGGEPGPSPRGAGSAAPSKPGSVVATACAFAPKGPLAACLDAARARTIFRDLVDASAQPARIRAVDDPEAQTPAVRAAEAACTADGVDLAAALHACGVTPDEDAALAVARAAIVVARARHASQLLVDALAAFTDVLATAHGYAAAYPLATARRMLATVAAAFDPPPRLPPALVEADLAITRGCTSRDACDARFPGAPSPDALRKLIGALGAVAQLAALDCSPDAPPPRGPLVARTDDGKVGAPAWVFESPEPVVYFVRRCR